MVSSRDGAAKGLNGHDASAKGEAAKAPEEHAPPLTGLVHELAQALGVARESVSERRAASPPPPPGQPSLSAAPSALPVAVGRHFFDDEEDDATMPIPSTWRAPPETAKPSSFNDQLRAAGLGFATGLVLVVPVVLLLTGKLGDFSLGDEDTQGSPPRLEARTPGALPEPPFQIQQRNVPTTAVAAATAEPEARQRPPAASRQAPPPQSWSEALGEGRQLVAAGNIVGAREVLTAPAAAEVGEALLMLAETFDPNMLAAWGVRGVAADVVRARSLYSRAVAAGVDQAKVRLRALD